MSTFLLLFCRGRSGGPFPRGEDRQEGRENRTDGEEDQDDGKIQEGRKGEGARAELSLVESSQAEEALLILDIHAVRPCNSRSQQYTRQSPYFHPFSSARSLCPSCFLSSWIELSSNRVLRPDEGSASCHALSFVSIHFFVVVFKTKNIKKNELGGQFSFSTDRAIK